PFAGSRAVASPALVWLRNYHTAPFAALEAPASDRKAVEALPVFADREAAFGSGRPAITPFRPGAAAFVATMLAAGIAGSLTNVQDRSSASSPPRTAELTDRANRGAAPLPACGERR